MYAIRQSRAAVTPPPLRPDGYYDPRFRSQALKVLPGEFLVSGEDVMLVTILGSCVSACIRDPDAGIGGMNHFMLPDTDAMDVSSESARYGAYAMEILINELIKHGADLSRLEAKVFGGGAVIPGFEVNNVGDRNSKFALNYLDQEGIPVLAQDLQDTCPRRVHYFPQSGKAMVLRLPSLRDTQETDLVAREKQYMSRLHQSPTEGSVELFQ